MPRLTYFAGLALLLLAGAMLLTDWLLWEPGITERNFKRIRAGMPLEKAEGILGGTPVKRPWAVQDSVVFFWFDEEGSPVACVVGVAGRVQQAHWLPGADRMEYEALRSWLRPGAGRGWHVAGEPLPYRSLIFLAEPR